MAGFCGNCGSPLHDTSAFCGACGARLPQANIAPAAAPVSPLSPPAPLPPVSPAPVRPASSPVVTIVLVVIVLFFVVGALATFAMFYALHLASGKAHEISRQVLRNSGVISSLTAGSGTAAETVGSVPTVGPGACRFLNREDVSRLIGVPIVATKTTDVSCAYLAKGTSAEMSGKHVAAMMARQGASAQQQQMIQSLSRGLLGSAPGRNDENSVNGNTVVVAFSIDPNSAQTQTTANENVLGTMGPGRTSVAGIGDEAFDTAGSVMLVRKGNKLIRITYSTCPCTVDAIKPLAQRLAAAL
jgi:hypothetical protein